MNEQINAVIKSVLISAGSVLVTRGYIDDTQLQVIVGAVLTLGTVAWAVYARRKAGIVKSAAKLSEVTEIKVTDQALADKAPKEVIGPKEVAAAQVNEGTAALYSHS